MSIPGLWTIVEPARQNVSLLELSIREGFGCNRHGTGTVVVGVDIGPIFSSAQTYVSSSEHGQKNPELLTLYYRLTWLSHSGLSAVFVFDGPLAEEPRSTLNEHFQELITAFGFHCHTAPGKAEAELAFLNSTQVVDAILTPNSNVFLFGATQVIRSPKDVRIPKHLDIVEIFTADIFRKQCFTVPQFVLLAVISNDNVVAGHPQYRAAIAFALSLSPLSESLFNAGRQLAISDLTNYLGFWRFALQDELANDRSGKLGHKYPALAADIPTTFPNPMILKQLCCPIQSESIPSASNAWFMPTIPNTSKLAGLCTQFFDWGPHILDHFISNIWDGYFIRKLIQNKSLGSTIPKAPPNFLEPTIWSINNYKIDQILGSPSAFSFYRITFWIPSLVAEAASSVLECAEPDTVVRNVSWTNSMSVWIPEPILKGYDALIAEYHADHAKMPIICPVSTDYLPVLECEFKVVADSVN